MGSLAITTMRREFESWVCIKELSTASGESLGLFLGFAEESLESIPNLCLDTLSFSFSSEHDVGNIESNNTTRIRMTSSHIAYSLTILFSAPDSNLLVS